MSFTEEVSNAKCSICLQRFHDPIILDCGHTFDRLCIEQLIDTHNTATTIRCPLCNQTFNPKVPLISNKSLSQAIQCEPTFEWFLIDISSSEQKANVLIFLKGVFNQRDIFETNHITFETADSQMTIHSDTDFEKELKIKSLPNLNKILSDACAYLQERDGIRKICILTDGSTIHSNLPKVDSNIINQCYIIHLGDKNASRTRELATKINSHFGFFNRDTLELYVQHFLTHF